MKSKNVGVIGASSFVGLPLLHTIEQSGWRAVAFSRQSKKNMNENVDWRQITSLENPRSEFLSAEEMAIPAWVCTAPIWVLPDYFDFLKAHGVKRIVALSSTSLVTKGDSSDSGEQAVVRQLIDGETRLQNWAEKEGIDWVVIRTTMIYGLGKDKNISEIARLICRWRFFPLLGKGEGLRQPVHVEDVARACQAAITSAHIKNRVFNLSGGEVLSYKEMVKRIFIALDKTPYFVHIPRWGFRLALLGLRFLPRFRHWSVAMADRMNRNMIFDHNEAKESLGVLPGPFNPGPRDLPGCGK